MSMKQSKRILAAILAVCIGISSLSLTAFARDTSFKGKLSDAAAKGIELVLTGVLGAVDLLLPDGKNFYSRDAYKGENFLEGTGEFLTQAPENARWRLGSAEVSLVPSDYKEHNYYLGGYIMPENGMNNRVEELLDDMRARVIALDDSTGRGTAVFATIDCIGITNRDIREIRSRVLQKTGGEMTFCGITVSATHCHSGIDTEGLWTNTFGKVVRNLFKSVLHIGKMETGTDPKYMEFLYETVADTMVEACKRMQTGTMTYAVKDIGEDYFNNRNRSSASALMTDMNRLVFTPDDGSRPTMIVNIAAHPDVAGLPTNDGQSSGRGVSGDYVYYMGETINQAGYNFMFFNGAIAGIYMSRGKTNNGQDFTRRVQQSERYGNELGKMALAMTMTEDEIKRTLVDKQVEDAERAVAQGKGQTYTLWYEDWEPVEETALEPLFNLAFREVDIQVRNPFIRIAGKLNLAAYDVLKEGRKYFIRTEIGYMELGSVRVALMPGEVCQDLVVGGTSVTADGSFTGKAFSEKTIAELFGEGTIVFGLANDAIGYVIPDNDYCMSVAFDHYHELISLGETTASTLMRAFALLADACKS